MLGCGPCSSWIREVRPRRASRYSGSLRRAEPGRRGAGGRGSLFLVERLGGQLGAPGPVEADLDVVAGVVVERDQGEALLDQLALVGCRRAELRGCHGAV